MYGNSAAANTRNNMQESDTVNVITVSTSRFGAIEVAPDKIINMTSPFLGFPESKRFLLKQHSENSPFMWLQSLDDPGLAFVVVQPDLILAKYQPPIPSIIKNELQITCKSDQEILLILTIPQGQPKEMTANLLGPVIFNVKERLAKQVLLDPGKYDPCWQVFGKAENSK